MMLKNVIKRMLIGLIISVVAGGFALIIANEILKKYGISGVKLWPIL